MEGANTTVMKFAESCSLGWDSGFLPNEQGKFFVKTFDEIKFCERLTFWGVVRRIFRLVHYKNLMTSPRETVSFVFLRPSVFPLASPCRTLR